MPPLIWTPNAARNLLRLKAFLDQDDLSSSAKAMSSLLAKMELLVTFPGLGRPIDSREPGAREWTLPFGRSAYLVLYRPEKEQIVLLALRHGREADYS